MNYMDWLAEQYEPRFITVEELEEDRVKPLDFIPIASWDDLKKVAEMKTGLKYSDDAKPAEVCLDLVFVSCRYKNYEGQGYEGSVVAVVSYDYKNRVEYTEFKTFLTGVFQNLDGIEKFEEYLEKQ